MDFEKIKERVGYKGKSQQWQYGFDLAIRELQQAQKVAVPDSGVNLNKFDLLRKMHNIRDLNSGEYHSDEIEENICAVEAMIEAQEN